VDTTKRLSLNDSGALPEKNSPANDLLSHPLIRGSTIGARRLDGSVRNGKSLIREIESWPKIGLQQAEKDYITKAAPIAMRLSLNALPNKPQPIQ